MEKNLKIYIAGHRGMVGSSVLRTLLSGGYNNIVTRTHDELDLTRQAEVEDFFERERPQYVILAAAKVGGILANNKYKADFIYDNIMISSNVIRASYDYGVEKLLNLGSSCIYPKFAEQPMKEEALLKGALEPTNEPYAIAKIAAIKLCRYFNEQYRSNFISIMPTNLYGPHDNYNLETSHVLPAFLRKFHLAKLLRNRDYASIRRDIEKYPLGFNLENKLKLDDEGSIINSLERLGINRNYVTLWGTGEAYREFLHADDLADAAIFIMLHYDFKDVREFVNIGTGKDIKIKDLADLIRDIVGFEGDITYDHSKPDGSPRKLLDISRLKGLGWKMRVSLKKGIKDTYHWYQNSVCLDDQLQ